MPVDHAALTRLLDTVGDDPAFVAELMADYLADSVELVQGLAPACAAADAEALRRRAHTLGSTSAAFGAERLAALCRELESCAQTGDCAAAAPLVEPVVAEWERVRTALPGALAQVAGG